MTSIPTFTQARDDRKTKGEEQRAFGDAKKLIALLEAAKQTNIDTVSQYALFTLDDLYEMVQLAKRGQQFSVQMGKLVVTYFAPAAPVVVEEVVTAPVVVEAPAVETTTEPTAAEPTAAEPTTTIIETAYFSDAHIAEAAADTTFIPANASEGLYVEVQPSVWVALEVCPFEGTPSQDFEGRFIFACRPEDYAAWVAEYAPAPQPEPTAAQPVGAEAEAAPRSGDTYHANRVYEAARTAAYAVVLYAGQVKDIALSAQDEDAERAADAVQRAFIDVAENMETLLRPYREAARARAAAWVAEIAAKFDEA